MHGGDAVKDQGEQLSLRFGVGGGPLPCYDGKGCFLAHAVMVTR